MSIVRVVFMLYVQGRGGPFTYSTNRIGYWGWVGMQAGAIGGNVYIMINIALPIASYEKYKK